MHTLQCLPLVRNKHCSNEITLIPVSVLDLEQNRLAAMQLADPYADCHLF
jgi:hypothetical protein